MDRPRLGDTFYNYAMQHFHALGSGIDRDRHVAGFHHNMRLYVSYAYKLRRNSYKRQCLRTLFETRRSLRGW